MKANGRWVLTNIMNHIVPKAGGKRTGIWPNLRRSMRCRFIASPDRSDESGSCSWGNGFKKPSLTEKTLAVTQHPEGIVDFRVHTPLGLDVLWVSHLITG